MRDHSNVVLNDISTKIGGQCELGRSELLGEIVESVESVNVIVVSGAAGSGKSGVAKLALNACASNASCFAFRAEEFAKAHLDEVLADAQIGLTSSEWFSLLASQGRKIVLIESIERILETTTRGALRDLLNLTAQDSSWRVMLTCRDYSLSTAFSSFLEHLPALNATVEVGELSDKEIELAVGKFPQLGPPAKVTSLRRLLRLPYILDKASRMNWPPGGTIPATERDFRVKFWSDVIRGSDLSRGLPGRREITLVKVALERAKARKPYISADGLDAEALQHLAQAGIVSFHERNASLISTAHDVLEDWALVHWIDGEYIRTSGHAMDFRNSLGTYPALRRSMRRWLLEMLESTPGLIDSFVQEVVSDDAVPPYFRDDVIVSVLHSLEVRTFLVRNRTALLANSGEIFLRVVHLLRVACKTPSSWLAAIGIRTSSAFEPSGPGWQAVLNFAAENEGALLPAARDLIKGLVVDWSRLVSWQRPSPAGASSAAKLAFGLLPLYDGYRKDKERAEVAELIAKVPNETPEKFQELVTRAMAKDRDDHAAEALADALLSSMHAYAAARDFPDLVMALSMKRLCLDPADGRRRRDFSMDLGPIFGLSETREFFPASAYQGPFMALLRANLQKGVDLVVDILNQSVLWYSTHPDRYVEPPYEIECHLPNGSKKNVWANDRLWRWYRGTSVGPDILQSALMALEEVLLDKCERENFRVDDWLQYLLARTNNCAVMGVVASIVVAYPGRCVASALALVRVPEFVHFDTGRMVTDGSSASQILSQMPTASAHADLCVRERKTSDARKHRKQQLENAILFLQLGNAKDQVHAVLNELASKLPIPSKQSEEDKIWRLSLHRMDCRNYSGRIVTPQEVGLSDSSGSHESEKGGEKEEKQLVLLEASPPKDADLLEVIERERPRLAQQEEWLGLFNWAWRAFADFKDPNLEWRSKLGHAKVLAGRPRPSIGGTGPEVTAAVVVRDHWGELDNEDRRWCTEVLCAAVQVDCDSVNEVIRVQRHAMDSSRPAALVLPLILSKLSGDDRGKVLAAIATSLTHSVEEVVSYACGGISSYLFGTDPDLGRSLVGAIASGASALNAAYDSLRESDEWNGTEVAKADLQVRTDLRAKLARGDKFSFDAWKGMDANGRFTSTGHGRILRAIRGHTAGVDIQEYFFELAQWLASQWNLRRSGEGRRSYEFEHEVLSAISAFVVQADVTQALRVASPLVACAQREPKEVSEFVRDLVLAQDGRAERESFWAVWQAIADQFRTAKWSADLDERYADSSLAVKIFLGLSWKEKADHWLPLEGNSVRIHSLFDQLPASGVATDCYLRFLSTIGSRELPTALERLAVKV
jgi:hypothetical protein